MIYKPPTLQLTPTAIPLFPHLCLHADDSNCQRTDWGYSYTNPDGKRLADLDAKENLSLLYKRKDAPSSFSGR